MSKLAITTISIALLTASGFAASDLAQANGHEDPQAAIEKLQQEKSVLLKRLNNAVAYSKDRATQIEALQAKADAEQERRMALSTRLNNVNASIKTRMDQADDLQAQLESEQNKNKAMSNGISSALAVSKNRRAELTETQAMVESEQSKSKDLSKRLRNAIAFSKTRGAQHAEAQAMAESEQSKSKDLSNRLRNAIAFSKTRGAELAKAQAMAGSEQSKSKDMSKRLRNAVAFSKTRGAKLASAEKKNKELSKRLRNAIAYSKSRAQGQAAHGSSQGDDWAATESASLNAAFGGVQGTTINPNTDGSITIQVGNNGLFNTGSTILSANGSQLISTIAQELSGVEGYITVVGHTDNIPVGSSSRFSSNQELSFARAVSTLQSLSSQGINTGRLSAAGYGDDQPIAGNDTPEGRQQNRRVEIILRK